MALRELLLHLGVEVDRTGETEARSSLSNIKKAALGVAAVFATGKLAQGVGQMLDLASGAAETTNVINTAFGEMSGSVENWATRQADAMGRSRFELLEFAGATGAIVEPMLGSEKAAAKMGTGIAQLAVDLGSFFNKTDPEALQALQAGLIGSTEPMLKFGVNLQVASLEAFALAEGLGKTVKEMTMGEKVQLRYRFIMDQTKKAQGDAAKTAEGYANATKALRASIRDAVTVFGKEFLPAAERVLATLIPIVKVVGGVMVRSLIFLRRVFSGIGTAIDWVNQKFGGLGTTLALLLTGLVAVKIAFMLVGTNAMIAAAKTAAVWLLVNTPLIITIALLGFIALAILAVVEDFEAMGAGAESVTGTLIKGFADLLESTGSWAAAIKEVVFNVFEFWLGTSRETFDSIIGFFTSFIDFMLAPWVVIVDGIEGLFDGLVEYFTAIFQGQIIKAYGILWDGIRDTAKLLVNDIIGYFGGLFDFVSGGLNAAKGFLGIGGESAQTLTRVTQPGSNIAGVSPGAAAAAGKGAGGAIINQPNTDIKIEVDATGQSTPADIGSAVAKEVDAVLQSRDRQTQQAFLTAMRST